MISCSKCKKATLPVSDGGCIRTGGIVDIGCEYGQPRAPTNYDRDQYDKGFRDGRLSAEVEAEWTEENICSHCGDEACAGYDEEPWRTRYCPHCGAKMKNPEEYE
jgi:hypothetical protein